MPGAYLLTSEKSRSCVMRKRAAFLCGLPHDGVVLPRDAFRRNGIDVMPQFSEHRHESSGQILVELDPHRTWAPATSRSSCADAAAKTMAARTSCSAATDGTTASAAPYPSRMFPMAASAVARLCLNWYTDSPICQTRLSIRKRDTAPPADSATFKPAPPGLARQWAGHRPVASLSHQTPPFICAIRARAPSS